MYTLAKRAYRHALQLGGAMFLMLGTSPNTITLLALAIGVLAAVVFVATHNALVFAALALLGAFLDALDGEVARRSGTTSKLGGYLDAMCDRLYESALIFAAAHVTGHWTACFLLMVASFTVSYAKARAAVEIQIRNDHGWPEHMGREGRSIGFCSGIVLLGLAPDARWLGRDLFFWTLTVMIVTTFITAFQRILRARELLLAATPAQECGGAVAAQPSIATRRPS